MSARVQVLIRFLYEDTLYADTVGFIPRHDAIKIPQLRVEENQSKAASKEKIQINVKDNNNKSSKGKKQSDIEEQNIDQIEDIENDNEVAENEMENEGDGDEMEEEQPQPELQQNENEENQFEEESQSEEDDIEDDDNELSQLSRSFSANVNYAKYKTKRQKGQLENFLELPLKKPRKDAKKYDEATQLIRKEQKQRKRRQYIKKLMQAQQKATFDKILNETGRKFRQRQEKQLKQENQKEKKTFRTLGDVPKIITKQTKKGCQIILHYTSLFSNAINYQPNIHMSENCSICSQAIGKYKNKMGQRFCSVSCFKQLKQINHPYKITI